MYLLALTTLKKIIDEGSYSRGAAALFISQPSASQHIRQLERIFGAKLIEMVGRRATLTEAGRPVYDLACKVENEYEAARRQVDEALGRSQKLVTLVSNSSPLMYRLPAVIRAYSDEHPDVILKAFKKSTAEIVDAVKGGADIGVIQRPPAYDSAIESIATWRDEVVAVSAPNHALVGRHHLSAGDLSKHRMVAGLASWVRQPVEEWFISNGVDLLYPVEVSSFTHVRAAVLAGIGIGFMPRYLVDEDIASSRLAELEIDDLHIVGETHLVFRPNVSQAARSLIDKILESAAKANAAAKYDAPLLVS